MICIITCIIKVKTITCILKCDIKAQKTKLLFVTAFFVCYRDRNLPFSSPPPGLPPATLGLGLGQAPRSQRSLHPLAAGIAVPEAQLLAQMGLPLRPGAGLLGS